MRSILSFVSVVKRMGILDISIYKIMLLAVGLIVASYIPAVLTIDPLIYVGAAVILLIPVAIKTYTPRKDTTGFIATSLENFHHYKFSDIWLFELGMLTCGIVAYQYIPVLRSVDPLRWVAICLFGCGWIFSMWKHQKNA